MITLHPAMVPRHTTASICMIPWQKLAVLPVDCALELLRENHFQVPRAGRAETLYPAALPER